MLHAMSARRVARDLHTTAPVLLEHTCWRRFAAQRGDCKESRIASSNAIIIIIYLFIYLFVSFYFFFFIFFFYFLSLLLLYFLKKGYTFSAIYKILTRSAVPCILNMYHTLYYDTRCRKRVVLFISLLPCLVAYFLLAF